MTSLISYMNPSYFLNVISTASFIFRSITKFETYAKMEGFDIMMKTDIIPYKIKIIMKLENINIILKLEIMNYNDIYMEGIVYEKGDDKGHYENVDKIEGEVEKCLAMMATYEDVKIYGVDGCEFSLICHVKILCPVLGTLLKTFKF